MVKAHVVNALADLLSSKAKAEGLRLLFEVRDRRPHLGRMRPQITNQDQGISIGTTTIGMVRPVSLFVAPN
jgi:hypothetical protein